MSYRSCSYSETTTVAAPSITDDDILLILCMAFTDVHGGYPTVALPPDFTEIDSYLGRSSSNYLTCRVGWKRADGESGDYSWSASDCTAVRSIMGVYPGRLASGSPIGDYDEWSSAVADTVLGTDSISIQAGSDVVWIGGTLYSTLRSITDVPSGMNSRFEDDQCALADLLDQAAGPTGDKEGTLSGNLSTFKVAYLIELKSDVIDKGSFADTLDLSEATPSIQVAAGTQADSIDIADTVGAAAEKDSQLDGVDVVKLALEVPGVRAAADERQHDDQDQRPDQERVPLTKRPSVGRARSGPAGRTGGVVHR